MSISFVIPCDPFYHSSVEILFKKFSGPWASLGSAPEEPTAKKTIKRAKDELHSPLVSDLQDTDMAKAVVGGKTVCFALYLDGKPHFLPKYSQSVRYVQRQHIRRRIEFNQFVKARDLNWDEIFEFPDGQLFSLLIEHTPYSQKKKIALCMEMAHEIQRTAEHDDSSWNTLDAVREFLENKMSYRDLAEVAQASRDRAGDFDLNEPEDRWENTHLASLAYAVSVGSITRAVDSLMDLYSKKEEDRLAYSALLHGELAHKMDFKAFAYLSAKSYGTWQSIF